jgi:hypothetical protein
MMKDITGILVRMALLVLILFLLTRIFKKADEKSIISPFKAPYSLGNSPDSVRMEIIEQLWKFQEGYSKRDPGNIDAFMQSLYSRENIMILGTMPEEIYSGYENAARLVKTDWESWGDCRFGIDSANISSSGNTAWFSARGYVEFDVSRLLVLPLRLTGIMVKEDQVWKFRQQQFQFDIDFTFSLIAIIVISAWILISMITLIIKTVKHLKKT